MQKIILIACFALALSSCKFPDVEMCYMIQESGECSVYKSPEDGEGGEWEDTGELIPIESLNNHYAISAEDLRKMIRYFQRKCSPITE